jgi:uncharacterized membrane-anchored protein
MLGSDKLTYPRPRRVVTGADARRLRDIIDASSDPQEEADAINFKTNSELVYSWNPVGYVTSNDRSDVDPDDFLSKIGTNDAETNKLRQQRGLPTITTIGLRQKQTLNRDLNTVSWAIEAQDSNDGKVLNFVALKLGRYGFERIVWIADPNDLGNGNDLLVAVNAHKYDDGARYIVSLERTVQQPMAWRVSSPEHSESSVPRENNLELSVKVTRLGSRDRKSVV